MLYIYTFDARLLPGKGLLGLMAYRTEPYLDRCWVDRVRFLYASSSGQLRQIGGRFLEISMQHIFFPTKTGIGE